MSNVEYDLLVRKVRSIDYFLGPQMRFEIAKSINKTHLSMFSYKPKDKIDEKCLEIEGETNRLLYPGISKNSIKRCRTYNLSLLADFLYNLEKQVKDNPIRHPDNLAFYHNENVATDYVLNDREGRRYVILTARGVKLFREIWDNGNHLDYDKNTVPFSVLEKKGLNLISEQKMLNGEEQEGEDIKIIAEKKGSSPSILIQNTFGSAGYTPEYSSSDRSVVGSRKSLKGRFLAGNFE